MDIADVMNSAAHRIQQGSTATGEVLLLSHTGNLVQWQAVMDDHTLVVEEYGGHHGLALFFLLLFNHGVEAADGVALQPAHGSAPVQDKNQFCHNENPPLFCALIIARSKEGLVA